MKDEKESIARLRAAVLAAADDLDDLREIAALQQWAGLEPSNGAVWGRLASKLRAIRQLHPACTAFAHAVALGIDDATTRRIYGWTLNEIGEHAQALEQLDLSARLEPTAATSHMRGQVLFNLKQYGEAEIAFRDTLREEPMHEEAMAFLALTIRFNGGSIDEPERLLRKAIEIDRDCPMGLRELGYVLIQTHRFDEARELLEEAVAANPDDAWARMYLGLCHAYCGRDTQAEQRYLEACAIDPNLSVPKMLCGMFYRQQGDFAEAEQILREAVRLRRYCQLLWMRTSGDVMDDLWGIADAILERHSADHFRYQF